MLDIIGHIGTWVAGHIGTWVAVGVAIWVYFRQVNAQMYMEYTKRCDQILLDFPCEVRLNLAEAAPGSVSQLRTLRYFNLCSEEFCMWKNRYLSPQVWRIWEEEIKRFLRSPLARAEWEKIRKEFDSFEAFQKYVDTVQNATT